MLNFSDKKIFLHRLQHIEDLKLSVFEDTSHLQSVMPIETSFKVPEKLEEEILKNLKNCKNRFTLVNVKAKFTDKCSIQLTLNSLFKKTLQKDKTQIESENILDSILLGTGDCHEEEKKVAARGYKNLNIHLSIDKTNLITAKIFAL